MLVTGAVSNRPFVAVRGLADLAKEPKREEESPVFEDEASLAGYIRKAWERNKIARARITQRLLRCLRARRGVYSTAELQKLSDRGTLNAVWVDLTEEKCKAASAWVREVLMPVSDLPFDIEPSPVSDIPPHMQETIVRNAAAEAQKTLLSIGQAGGELPSIDEFRQMASEIGKRMKEKVESEIRAAADRGAKRMRRLIADQMAQGGWNEAMDSFIEDFVTYPAAVMMGPIYKKKRRIVWTASGMKVEEVDVPSWQWIDIFDVYPDPTAQDCQTGNFIVRRRFRRKDLVDSKGMHGWRDDQIDLALRAYENGHIEGWIWQEAERQRLQQETLYSFLSPRGTIDAIQFFGSVQGWHLMSWAAGGKVAGIENLDPLKEYEVEAILIGPYVVRCVVNDHPTGMRPIFSACFDRVPGSFWGRSIPDLCETSQKMVNASACALADNMSWASGPQAWVHVDRLADGENSVEIVPLKVWQLKSDPTQGVNPGVGFFQPNSNVPELMALIEKWMIRADDATGVPRYTYGNERVGGAASTYSGLAMLMNNAAKGLRRAIAQVDTNVIQPSVYIAFVNEMMYGNDPSAKVDCMIVPRGGVSMLIREARNQALMNAAQLTANPVDMQVIGEEGRAELLRRLFSVALEVDPEGIVPDDAKLRQKQEMQQQAAQQAAQLQAEQRDKELSVDLEKAKLHADVERERIASGERIKGAELAAKKLEKQQARQLRFTYDDAGNIIGAVREDGGL